METRILDIVNKGYSAVISNLNENMLAEIRNILDINEYPYVVLSSTSNNATHRLGFPNGINEYMGSESFVKLRLQAEIKLLNEMFNLNIDEYYLDYVLEWMYHKHIMDTPLNYLDNDGNLFEYLQLFFEDRNADNPNTEDQVAIKLMQLFSEIYKDDANLPILQLRSQVFTKPGIILISEANSVKATYIKNAVKLFYHDFQLLEASSETPQMHIEYITFNN